MTLKNRPFYALMPLMMQVGRFFLALAMVLVLWGGFGPAPAAAAMPCHDEKAAAAAPAHTAKPTLPRHASGACAAAMGCCAPALFAAEVQLIAQPVFFRTIQAVPLGAVRAVHREDGIFRPPRAAAV